MSLDPFFRRSLVMVFLFIGWLQSSAQSISGTTCVAASSQNQYTLSGTWTSSTLTWSVTGGTINGSSSGTDLTQITVTWGGSGSGTVSVSTTSPTNNYNLSVTIYAPLTPGAITSGAGQGISYNTTPATITCAAPTGGYCTPSYLYQWWYSTNQNNYSTVAGATGLSLSFGTTTLTQTTYYVLEIVDSYTGVVAWSSVAAVYVWPSGQSGVVAGYTCMTTGTQDEYTLSCNNCTSSTTMTWSVAGGTISGSSSGSGLFQVPVNWTRTGSDTVEVITASPAYTFSLVVSSCPALSGGTITSGGSQTINYNKIPANVVCSGASGGNCFPEYYYQWESSTNGTTWQNISGATSLTLNLSATNLTQTTYYVCEVNDPIINTVAYSTTATVTVYPQLVSGPITPASQTIVSGTAPATLNSNSSGGNGSYTYQWLSASPSGGPFAPISGATGATYNPPALTAPMYYQVVTTSNGVQVTSVPASVAIYPPLAAGAINPGSLTLVAGTGPGVLTSEPPIGGNGTYAYQWQSSTNGSTFGPISGAPAALSYNPGNLTTNTWYRMAVTSNGQTVYSAAVQMTIGTLNNDLNYIRTRTLSRPGVTDTVTADGLTSPYDVQQSTAYFDGLARSIQTVAMQASPLGNDMVTIQAYDPYDREATHYLPYTSPSNTGNYKTDPTSEQQIFNAAQFPNDQYYYGQTGFEASPLNRVLNQYAPGNSWVGSGRNVGAQYLINSIADSVQQWVMFFNPMLQVSTYTSGDSVTVTYTPSHMPSTSSTVLYLYEAQGGTSWTTGTVNSGQVTQIKIPVGNYSFAIQVYTNNTSFYVYPGVNGIGFTISGVYPTGNLYKTVTTDENGNQVVEFKDVRNLTILKKVQAGFVLGGEPYTNWLCTYYIYDDDNNLSVVLPPAATQQLWSRGWVVPSAGIAAASFVKELCFQYTYDGKNRMVTKSIPGGGTNYIVYDARDRVIMTQDSNLIAQGKWHVTEYDSLNRSWRTGLLTDPNNQAYEQNLAYSSISYPNTSGSNYEILTQTYFDDYSWVAGSGTGLPSSLTNKYFNFNNDFVTSFNTSPTYAVPMTYFPVTRGMATGSRTEILGSNGTQYLADVNFYDDRGRLIQVQSVNYTGGVDTVTNQYDFTGKPLRNMLSHAKLLNTSQYHTVVTKMDYDAFFRLRHIWKNVDAAASDQLIDSMRYNELGQLSAKYLGNNVDSLSYTYNIRGWLSGINPNYVAGTTTHYFGMELGYDRTSSVAPGNTYITPEFNGNIEGTVWKTAGSGLNRKYDFTYDAVNRITGAAFLQNSSGSSWDKNQVDFSVSNLSYDPNGNIRTMSQRGFLVGGSQVIDSLTYGYSSNGSNKLLGVLDNAPNNSNSLLGDFHYSISKTNDTTDYTYDGNGNLNQDKNKAITSISFNYLNLPQLIHFQSKGNIRYVYDASGEKLAKITTDSVAQDSTRTLYLDGLVYQYRGYMSGSGSAVDTLQFISHEEGRVRWAYHVYTAGPPGYAWSYDFFEKDHLGNTRMVLTQEHDTTIYVATMEAAYRATESQLFGNIASTSYAWNSMPNEAANISSSIRYPPGVTVNDSVSKVTGNAGQTIGPSLLLKVMAGDTIMPGVQCYYVSNTLTTTNSSFNSVLNSLASGIVGTATGAAEATLSNLTSSSGTVYSGLTSFLSSKDPAAPSGYPKTYLNWILLDDQFNYVSSSSGSVAAASTTYPANQMNPVAPGSPVVMSRNGYLYVWVSNETQGWDVFFDNFSVQYKQGPVLEENHYYPFGLTMSGISDKAIKTSYAENKYRYNGKELQHQEFSDGSGLEEYDYGARLQDPQLGVWHNVDPHADKYVGKSPYTYAFDNPLVFVDPNGMDNIVYLSAADKSVTNKQLKAIAKAASANFASMGLKTQVKVFKGPFDSKAYGKLDKTDAVAVIGNRDNVIKAISSFNPQQGNVLASSDFGSNRTDAGTNPEESQSPRSSATDNIIAIGTEATKTFAKDANSSFEDAAGFLIDHGAGHLSDLKHAGDLSAALDDTWVPKGPNIMSSGNDIISNIKTTPLQNYVTSPINQQPANNQEHTLSIKQAYLQRFGNDTPVPKLPTQP